MSRRDVPPLGLDEAMERANREDLHRTRRERVLTRLRQATLLLLFLGAVSFVVVAIRSGSREDSHSAPTKPSSGLDIGFDLSDALPLCLERDGTSIRAQVPPTFGRVDRAALVSADLRATHWEVQARPAVKLTWFEIGVTPPGFTAEHEIQGEVAREGIVVINGPTNIGLAVIDPKKLGAPGSCA